MSQLSGQMDLENIDDSQPLLNATMLAAGPDVVFFTLPVKASLTGFTLLEARGRGTRMFSACRPSWAPTWPSQQ